MGRWAVYFWQHLPGLYTTTCLPAGRSFCFSGNKKDFRFYPAARQQKIIFQLLICITAMNCVYGYAKLNPFEILRASITASSKPFTLISPNQSSNPPSPPEEETRARLFRSNLQVIPLPGRGNEGEALTSHHNPPQSSPSTDGSDK